MLSKIIMTIMTTLFLTASSTLLQSDHDALIQVYNGFSNKEVLGWNTAQDLCSQGGVTCDSSSPQRVTGLTFFLTELTGTVATEIGLLSSLNVIYFGINHLTGSIPTEIGGLSQLNQLILSSNQFTGSIPTEFGNLDSLTDLELYGNQLTGPIPTHLGNMDSLEQLNLSWNNMTGSIPAELGNLQNLFLLWTKANQLTGSIPSEIFNLPILRQLIVSANYLDCPIPDFSHYQGDDSQAYQDACAQYCGDNACPTGTTCYLSSYTPDYTFTGASCRSNVVATSTGACDSNPCQNHGVCSNSGSEFTCDCSGTGFSGAVCTVDIYCTSSTDSQTFSVFPKTHGSATAKGSCQAGYQMSIAGPPTRRCNSNGVWNPKITNPCVLIECPATTVNNAHFPETDAGKSSQGTCQTGYSGTVSRKCNSNGSSTITGTCQRIQCKEATFGGVKWPVTFAGSSSSTACVNHKINLRSCSVNGVWTSNISTKSC